MDLAKFCKKSLFIPTQDAVEELDVSSDYFYVNKNLKKFIKNGMVDIGKIRCCNKKHHQIWLLSHEIYYIALDHKYTDSSMARYLYDATNIGSFSSWLVFINSQMWNIDNRKVKHNISDKYIAFVSLMGKLPFIKKEII